MPVMVAQAFNGTEETVLTGQLAATDPGDTLTFAAATNPMGGAVTVTGAGAFTYTPNANFSGADTFTARVTDGASQSVTATITLNIAGVNDAPTAYNDVLAVTSTGALDILANDTDPDNDALAVTITDSPFVGTATVNANRTVNLDLPAGFKGFSKFSYRVTDAGNVTSDATALVFVGIEPFKVVALSPGGPGAGPSGIFVDDLFASRLVHEAGITYAGIQNDQISVAQSGKAVVFRYNGPNGVELRYVDLANPGQSRLIQGPLSAGESFGYQGLSRDGRFVVYEYLSGNPAGQQQLNVFDANGTGPPQRLSLPVADQPLARIGTFNNAGTAMYYAGMNATSPPWICAVYRVDFATRVATRVSLESNDTPAFFWPLPGDTSYVDIRFNAIGGMGAYFTSNANPAGVTRLHETLNNPNVYFPAQLSRDGTYFVFSEVTTTFGSVRLAVSRTAAPGSSITVGGAGFGSPQIDGLFGMRFDSQAMVVNNDSYTGGLSSIHEVPLATPATTTLVYTAPNPSTHFNSVFYSADGERITYIASDFNTNETWVAATRRGGFGQSTRLTPAGVRAVPYTPDASGYVLLVKLEGSPGIAALVNVDLPQVWLPVGSSDYPRFNIVAR